MAADSKHPIEEVERLSAIELRYITAAASLATKMRLTQQARFRPDSAVAAKSAPEMPNPWESA
jgi:hypothetical protein